MTLTSLTHRIRFPSDSDAELAQDQEWCEVLLDEGWTRIRFHDGDDPSRLTVLDLGAGNGMVGEALREHGFEEVTGVDITPEAGEAAERDRPGVYAGYHVCDLLDPPEDVAEELHEARFGAMTSVAGLGFGDVPPEVFTAALGLVEEGGWIAFTIKEDFLDGADDGGFAALIAGLLRSGAIEDRDRRRYQHRLDVNGDPIHYVAIAGVRR